MFAPTTTSRRRLLIAATALASLALPTAAHAAPAKPQPKAPVAVRVVTPSRDQLVTTGRVPVTLRVGAKVTRVRVFDGTKDISARFHKRGHGYSASLTRSTLKPGAHRLLIQAYAGERAGGTATTRLIVGKRAEGIASVSSGAKAAASLNAGAPGTSAYAPSAGSIPVMVRSAKPTVAQLSINGKRVADIRSGQYLNEHSYVLSRSDGLRAGTNHLKLVAYTANGRYMVKRWTAKRSGKLPFAEAGAREQKATTGKWLTLDGSKSRPAHKGDKLTYAWRIVKEPKGSHAKLRNPNAVKPQIKTDVAGVYQVALRATTSHPGMASAADAGSAAEDTTTIDATSQLPEQGLYVYTGLFGDNPNAKLTAPYDTLYIDGVGYTSQAPSGVDIFVQLDATTLAEVAVGDHTSITPKPGTITIGVWQGVSGVPFSPNDNQSGAEIWIGTTVVGQNTDPGDPGLNNGNGNAYLDGWIQPATADTSATWVNSRMLQVQTRLSTDTATTNTMVVNGQHYPVTLPAGAEGGYQVVMLDHNGNEVWSSVYPMTGDPDTDEQTENTMVGNMQGAALYLSYMIEGFGKLPAVHPGSEFSNFVQTGGGNADVLSRLNGTTDSTGGSYALIMSPTTTTASRWTAEETSHERTGGDGSLSALMVRDPAGADYIPFTSDSALPDTPDTNEQMLPLIYSAPTPWTNWMRDPDTGALRAPTAAETAAFDDIVSDAETKDLMSSSNELCPGAPDAIRAYYCNSDSQELSNFASNILNQISFDSSTANGRYTATDFRNVQLTINAEALDASDIRSAINDYQDIFGADDTSASVNAQSIGTAIAGEVSKSNTQSLTNMLNVMSAATDMASVLPEVGPAFTFLSGAFSLASDLLPNSTSVDDILTNVQTTQQTVSADLATEYLNAGQRLETYGDYLASDPVKLEQGANLLSTTFALSGKDLDSAEDVGANAANEFLWGSMLAPAYQEWTAPFTLGTNPICGSDGYTGHPFANIDATTGIWSSWTSIVPTNWFLGLRGSQSWIQGQSDVALPGSITTQLFGAANLSQMPTGTSDVGAVMPYFANTYLTKGSLPSENDNYPFMVGCQAG